MIFANRISAVLLAISLFLAIASIWLDPMQHRLSLNDDFHLSVQARGLDTRIVFFNHADYGPYRGSMVGILDAQGNVYPPLEVKRYFGDFAGVYYRYFRWSDATL
jgi:hypothetical protein